MEINSFLRKWLDRVLIFNLFLVILGAIYFLVSIILNIKGIQTPFIVLQKLWKPLIIPIITIMVSSILFSGFMTWLKNKGLDLDQDN